MQALDTASLVKLILEVLGIQLGSGIVIDADTPFAALGVDSIGVVILIAELETQIGFTFEPEDLDMDFFRDPLTLAGLLVEKYITVEVPSHG